MAAMPYLVATVSTVCGAFCQQQHHHRSPDQQSVFEIIITNDHCHHHRHYYGSWLLLLVLFLFRVVFCDAPAPPCTVQFPARRQKWHLMLGERTTLTSGFVTINTPVPDFSFLISRTPSHGRERTSSSEGMMTGRC